MQDIGQLTYLPECPLCARTYGFRTMACAIRMCLARSRARLRLAEGTLFREEKADISNAYSATAARVALPEWRRGLP
jgi:hypothetical protein